jgi:hypothetical protein
MTQSNQSGQPNAPGTPGYVQHIDAQTAMGSWQHQQSEQAREQQEQQPGPAYARQQRPLRRSWRFPWRVIAWIATAFALLWTAGVVIDVANRLRESSHSGDIRRGSSRHRGGGLHRGAPPARLTESLVGVR